MAKTFLSIFMVFSVPKSVAFLKRHELSFDDKYLWD